MAGIYIHIPFCKQACHYCDFHFSVNGQTKRELIAALVHELELQKNYLQGEPVETVYLGGGTPSILDPQEIALILRTVRSTHRVDGRAEVTLEANPDDLTLTKLKQLNQTGINRLSIGIQTFNSAQLKFLNRAHDGMLAVKSFYEAREAGFSNISIDLMYALPGESPDELNADIQKAVELSPEHISCYALTIEEKTAFGKWTVSGKLKPVPDEVSAGHLEIVMQKLSEAGYDHYEISNFAKPGCYSKHNSNYWRGTAYLGVGPSAHSFNKISRQHNRANNQAYVTALKAGTIPFEREILSTENKINEYILTTLRTSWGTDVTFIKQAYGHDLLLENKDYISNLMNKKLITLEHNFLKLTQTGKLMADKISSDLFIA